MVADTSITVYHRTDRCPGGRGAKKEITFTRPSRASMDVARRRWQQMQHDRLHHIDRGFTTATPAQPRNRL